MEKTESYSGLFIIDPEKESAIDDVKTSIGSVISDNSGSIAGENMMGKRRLAYPIKKKTEGIYYQVQFDAPPEAITKITRQCQINLDILRTIIDRK